MEKILTLNAGSSSIKFAVFDIANGQLSEAPSISGQIAGLKDEPVMKVSEVLSAGETTGARAITPEGVVDHDTAWPFILGWLEEALNGAPLVGVGHRIVHGGVEFTAPVRLDDDKIARLRALASLAPGHQPFNLAGLAAAQGLWREAAQVACFDTSFHRTQPRREQRFALPRAMTEAGVIRYGFHGLSYEYISQTAPKFFGDYPGERMIVAHLGAGASMCAIKNGKSVATTMGFSALDGLPMATRCGALDPGVVLHMIGELQMSSTEVRRCLYEESGLLGVSGISGDMQVLENSDDPHAADAIDLFIHRAAREIGSLAAALGGIDAMVFTAGVGENSARIREGILDRSKWLGFELDRAGNDANKPRITKGKSIPSAWTIATNEELMIARHTHRVAGGG